MVAETWCPALPDGVSGPGEGKISGSREPGFQQNVNRDHILRHIQDFQEWKEGIHIKLQEKDLLYLLTEEEEDLFDYEWEDKNHQAMEIIKAAVSPLILQDIAGCYTAAAMWEVLELSYHFRNHSEHTPVPVEPTPGPLTCPPTPIIPSSPSTNMAADDNFQCCDSPPLGNPADMTPQQPISSQPQTCGGGDHHQESTADLILPDSSQLQACGGDDQHYQPTDDVATTIRISKGTGCEFQVPFKTAGNFTTSSDFRSAPSRNGVPRARPGFTTGFVWGKGAKFKNVYKMGPSLLKGASFKGFPGKGTKFKKAVAWNRNYPRGVAEGDGGASLMIIPGKGAKFKSEVVAEGDGGASLMIIPGKGAKFKTKVDASCENPLLAPNRIGFCGGVNVKTTYAPRNGKGAKFKMEEDASLENPLLPSDRIGFCGGVKTIF
jgi:hypothetical protein